MEKKSQKVYFEYPNGLILHEYALLDWFTSTKPEHLVKYQATCKLWRDLIMHTVWHRKAGEALNRQLKRNDSVPWFYYFIVSKRVLDRNLIRNHSGGDELTHWHWDDLFSSFFWTVQEIPADIPSFPNDPIFKGTKHCFLFDNEDNEISQCINLHALGFSPKFLNDLQPMIKVSAYYFNENENSRCTFDVSLRDKNWDVIENVVYRNVTRTEFRMNQKWNRFANVFMHYGTGVKSLKFGITSANNCRIAGVSVTIVTPDVFPPFLHRIPRHSKPQCNK